MFQRKKYFCCSNQTCSSGLVGLFGSTRKLDEISASHSLVSIHSLVFLSFSPTSTTSFIHIITISDPVFMACNHSRDLVLLQQRLAAFPKQKLENQFLHWDSLKHLSPFIPHNFWWTRVAFFILGNKTSKIWRTFCSFHSRDSNPEIFFPIQRFFPVSYNNKSNTLTITLNW